MKHAGYTVHGTAWFVSILQGTIMHQLIIWTSVCLSASLSLQFKHCTERLFGGNYL